MLPTPLERRILQEITRKRMTSGEIRASIFQSPSRQTLCRVLNGLIQRGEVTKTGNGRGTRYEMKNPDA